MMNFNTGDRETELIGFVSEMNGLIEMGILKNKVDFKSWLNDSRSECTYCFSDLSEIVNIYIKNV